MNKVYGGIVWLSVHFYHVLLINIFGENQEVPPLNFLQIALKCVESVFVAIDKCTKIFNQNLKIKF